MSPFLPRPLTVLTAGFCLMVAWALAQSPTGFMTLDERTIDVVINEFMASNQTGIMDPEGSRPDWLELHNSTELPIDIGGMHLTDNLSQPLKWQVPTCCPEQTTIPALGYLILWIDDDEEDGPLHASFNLSASGESIRLTADDGLTVLDEITYGQQLADVSFGRFPDGNGPYWFFNQPTPGAPNEQAGLFSDPPTFSRPGGTFTAPFQLELGGGGGAFTVRYTVDGSAPTAASPAYTTPLDISTSRIVTAGLFSSDGTPGPMASAAYVRLGPAVASFESGLGIVVVDSFGYNFANDSDPFTEYPDQLAAAVFIPEVPGGRASILDAASYAGRVGMRVRGASTKMWPKKQYKLETWDEQGNDKDFPLLGMPSESDWILFAPYFDRSLMRNHLVYSLWERLGHWSPRMKWVEVYINMNGDGIVTPSDFVGLYQVMESIKRDGDRLDIARLEPQDVLLPAITGGHAVQATNIQADFGLTTGPQMKHVEPDATEILPVQAQWIRDHLNELESVLFGGGFSHPVTGFRAYTDEASHVDYDIMREVTRNIDGASTYMWKDRGGPLFMGPLWDYDQSFGNTSLFEGYLEEGFNWGYTNPDFPNWLKWWPRLDDDPDYQQAFVDKYAELRSTLLGTETLLDEIDATAALLDEAQQRNYARWPILGTEVWAGREAPNWPTRTTYQAEIDWLKQWTADRLAWMDTQHLPAPTMSVASSLVTIEHASGAGAEIHYTLDGRDPRHSAPATVAVVLPEDAAKRVLVPTGNIGTTWRTLPAFDDFLWTSGTGAVGYEADSGYEGLIDIDVLGTMYQVNQTVYTRATFSMTADALLDAGSLVLQARVDDGFVAWLNGTEIARANAPATPTWNSGATAGTTDAAAVKLATFTVPAGLLGEGPNLLAVQGLNFQAGSSDFLLSYRLVAWAPGSGTPSRTATQYTGPFTAAAGTLVTGRARVGGEWTPPARLVVGGAK